MSRSGYSDDWDGDGRPPEFYRRSLENAINGKRGQAFLQELLESLDALPEKRLIENSLRDADGEVCALGAVGLRRGLDMSKIDPEDPYYVAKAFKIPRCLASEIEFENDDDFSYLKTVTPEQRWTRMRAWVAGQLVKPGRE